MMQASILPGTLILQALWGCEIWVNTVLVDLKEKKFISILKSAAFSLQTSENNPKPL